MKKLSFFLMAMLFSVMSFAQTTVTKTTTDLVTEHSWTVSAGSTIGTLATEFALDEVVTISTSGEANCGTIWLNSDQHNWRLYQAKAGNITIAVKAGYQLKTINLIYTVSDGGTLLDGTTVIASESDLDVTGLTSKTLVVGNTGSKTNGQVRITQFSVTYVATSGTTEPETPVEPEEPVVPEVPENLGAKTIAEFLELKNTTDTCVLTGVVANIANTTYGNFDLVDATGSVYVYGLLTAAGESKQFASMDIAAGDTLTVKAIYNEYNGKPQAKNAIYVSHTKTATPIVPENLGAKTIAEFLELKNTTDTCVLTGVVANIANTTYGNFDLVDATGSVYVYGLLTAAGESKQFASMDIAAGDTLTVKAIYNEYNGKSQAKNAIYVSHSKLVLTVEVTSENGTVDGLVDGGKYVRGAEATLTATAAEGYEFTCWTSGEDTVSTENPYTFVVTANVALVANFNKKAEPEHTYTVAGAPATLFGTEWDPANTANDMNKQEDGTYKWEKTDVELATSSIQFKVAKNHAWTEAYPGDNYNLAITESGKYTITITFNAETKEVNAVATLQEVVEIIPTIAIAGDMNGWNTTANEFVMAEDKLTATLALTLEAKDYGFKMIIAGGWTSDAATITRENNSATFVNNGDNSTLAADVAGEYTFTWTYATNTLTVTYPVASEPTYEVYEVEIKDLVIDYDNLVLSGSANDPFQVAVTLGLGEYNRNDDTYQLIPESYVELNGSGATFVEGYASVNGFDQTATAVVRCVWSGMNIELHLNMSSAPIEATVVVVENATAMVEKVLLFGDMYDYALKITGEWINPEDGLTYPVLVEVPVYYPEATEPSEIMSTVTVGDFDNGPWLGFGEGTLTITTVGDVVTATGVVQNPMAGVAIDITISGTIVTTDLDGVTVTAKPVKMIQNGQLIIIKNGVEYNAQGAQL